MNAQHYEELKRIFYRIITYGRAGPEPPGSVWLRSKCQLSQGPPP